MVEIAGSKNPIAVKEVPPNTYPDLPPSQRIIVMQSPTTRALNVGFVRNGEFVPGRLTLGMERARAFQKATVETLELPQFQEILERYNPSDISTVTLLREANAHRLGESLYEAGVPEHYGDSFVGIRHEHVGGERVAKQEYLNIEGLKPNGLWIVADSICKGRNLYEAIESLLETGTPDEVIILSGIASRIGIKRVGRPLAEKGIPTTFFAWGGLFGVDEVTQLDMPWGHPDTEPLDPRDQQTAIEIYGPEVCVGGDFGNNFYFPQAARNLYTEQLLEHGVTERIPTSGDIFNRYSPHEILTEE